MQPFSNQQSVSVAFATYQALKSIHPQLINLSQTFIVGTQFHKNLTSTHGQIVKLLKLYSQLAHKYLYQCESKSAVVITQSPSAPVPNPAFQQYLL